MRKEQKEKTLTSMIIEGRKIKVSFKPDANPGINQALKTILLNEYSSAVHQHKAREM